MPTATLERSVKVGNKAAKRVIVIPARMNSSRLPNKPMLLINGIPLIRYVYDKAKLTSADYVIVTSPDREVLQYCAAEGMLWRPSSPDCPTGTHRVIEVLRAMDAGPSEIGIVVNWQVDEPDVDPADVDRLMNYMQSPIRIATLVRKRNESEKTVGSGVVKAAIGEGGRILWFDRHDGFGNAFHCGVYAFEPEVLRDLWKTPTPLSRDSSLEQLSWIEWGWWIISVEIDRLPISVNTPEDLEALRRKVE